ncbi:uncharacterized protein LOC111383673 [Olea europaea var. sylvestris]|uniref:uncharacterized protein LOC111383673 n=1 Tax=Olea europaea var. sylvestris TaxID=158386 RepID=UPI000C1D23AA|nr:uncharacterized protein LOC111383673 [Olea europaea var. sylvestris]
MKHRLFATDANRAFHSLDQPNIFFTSPILVTPISIRNLSSPIHGKQSVRPSTYLLAKPTAAKSAPSRKWLASAFPILEDDDDDDDDTLIVRRKKSSASPLKALVLAAPVPSSFAGADSSKLVDEGTTLKEKPSVLELSSQPIDEPPSSQGADPPNVEPEEAPMGLLVVAESSRPDKGESPQVVGPQVVEPIGDMSPCKIADEMLMRSCVPSGICSIPGGKSRCLALLQPVVLLLFQRKI